MKQEKYWKNIAETVSMIHSVVRNGENYLQIMKKQILDSERFSWNALDIIFYFIFKYE
jgi:hypothetical protein